jgi:hypothetical protein
MKSIHPPQTIKACVLTGKYGIFFTFDFLKPYLESIHDITYVIVWRPLDENIQSLAHRNNFDFAAAQTILEPYYANLNYHREQLEKENKDIVDIHFTDLLENPEDFLKMINLRLNYDVKEDRQKLHAHKSYVLWFTG